MPFGSHSPDCLYVAELRYTLIASFDGGSSLSKRASIAPSLRSNASSASISGIAGGGRGSAQAKFDYTAQSGSQLSITSKCVSWMQEQLLRNSYLQMECVTLNTFLPFPLE